MAKRKRSPRPLPNIGKEELAVLQYVQLHAPVTVRQVAEHFADAGKARTTILTMMERLREKGLLEREKAGGAFQYRASVESSVVMKSLVGDFVQRVLGGSLSPFMAYMSDAEDLSDQEIDQLKEIIRDMESKGTSRRETK